MESNVLRISQGTIIKVPDVKPGIIFASGQQYTFQVERIWRSATAPAINQVVEIEFDGAGEIAALTLMSGGGTPFVPPPPVHPASPDREASRAAAAAPAPAPSAAPAAASKSAWSKKKKTMALVGSGLVLLVAVVASAVSSSNSGPHEVSSSERENALASNLPPSPPPAPSPPPFQPDAAAVSKARRFLEQKDLADTVVGVFLHFGAKMDRQVFKGIGPLNDANGNPTSGFAALYRYEWDSDGWTDVAYIVDSSGNVSHLQVMGSNGKSSKPFALARLGGALMGAALQDSIKNDQSMTDQEKATLQSLLQNAEIEKILDLILVVRQRTGN